MRRHRAGPRNHFQIQRALLSLIASDDGTSVAFETLDDLVVEGDEGAIRDFEQLLLGAGDVAGFVGAEEVAAWLEGELLTTGLNHHPSGPVALARFGDLAQRALQGEATSRRSSASSASPAAVRSPRRWPTDRRAGAPQSTRRRCPA